METDIRSSKSLSLNWVIFNNILWEELKRVLGWIPYPTLNVNRKELFLEIFLKSNKKFPQLPTNMLTATIIAKHPLSVNTIKT